LRAQWHLGNRPIRVLIFFVDIRIDTIDAIGILIEFVEAQLIGDIKNQEQAECNANGEPKNIEDIIPYVFLKIAKRN